MTVIVRDDGFHADDWAAERSGGAHPPDVLDLDPGADAAALDLAGVAAIRVRFPAFSDGRGFTLAHGLRARGFSGRLRAAGPLIADQYAMARRAGFDEVEIPDALAARQPEAHWLARADWRRGAYQARLRGVDPPT
jgi:uncharacterized protein (DUF934 family)